MCAYQSLGKFRDNSSDTQLAIKDLQTLFTLSAPFNGCAEKPGHYYMTNQGMVIWSEVTLKTVSTHSHLNVTTPDPESAKLSFLSDYLGTQATKTLAQVQQRLCHLAQMTLDLLWQILQFEPTMGGQALLQ